MKPKHSETGFQTAAAGGAGATALVALDVAGATNVDLEHMLVAAGVAMVGMLYRLGVKWIERGASAAADQIDEFGGER